LAPLWQKYINHQINNKSGWKCVPPEFKTGTYCTQHHVGDQNRVKKITQFFDSIEFSTQRNSKQTGLFKARELV
jgi:hypothetical protein